MSSSDKSLAALSKHYTDTIVSYVLQNFNSKLPVKYSRIASLFGDKERLLAESLAKAIAILQDRHGIKMKAVPDSDDEYICYPCVPQVMKYDNESERNMILIFLILSYILMSDKPIFEKDLFEFLAGLKIDVNAKHLFFGDNLKCRITNTFVNQLYLQSNRTFDKDNRVIYTWGFRSAVEFTETHVLKTTADMMKNGPKFFIDKLAEAVAIAIVKEEENEMKAKALAIAMKEEEELAKKAKALAIANKEEEEAAKKTEAQTPETSIDGKTDDMTQK